jgi:hypothetical protein
MNENPVTLPAGCAMLRIKPCSTGSFTTAKTMRELPENVCDNNIQHRLDQLCTVVLDATGICHRTIAPLSLKLRPPSEGSQGG